MSRKLRNALFIVSILLTLKTTAQTSLPLQAYNAIDTSKPLMLYVSGDGGMNNFSTTLLKYINTKGYAVIALNAKTYFWNKRLPEDAAKDIAVCIAQYMALYKRSKLVLMGYSFGADVLPFIQNKLPVNIADKIKQTVLLSPSNNTDFEVHLFYGSGGQSVPAEINKLTKPATVFFGSQEKETPVTAINSKLVTIVKLAGDHHYNNDLKTLAESICSRL